MRDAAGRRGFALLAILLLGAGLAALASQARDRLVRAPGGRALSREEREARIRRQGGIPLDAAGVLLQEAGNDCGAAALKMIFDRAGRVRPLRDWQREAIDRPAGSSMLRLAEAARAQGLRAEGWRIAAPDLPAIPLPAIALLDGTHYVVLERVDRATGAVEYADPALGRIRIDGERFHRRSQGRLLLFPEADAPPAFDRKESNEGPKKN